MKKKMKVYICDICKTLKQPIYAFDSGGDYELKPTGWFENEDFHLCRECYRAFKELKERNNCNYD